VQRGGSAGGLPLDQPGQGKGPFLSLGSSRFRIFRIRLKVHDGPGALCQVAADTCIDLFRVRAG